MVGAARLSTPVTGELQGAAILPGSASAIAKNPGGALVRVGLKDGAITSLGIENVIDFAVSPSGTTVVARDAARLHMVSIADDARREFPSPGSARQIAVSDDGASIAVTVAEADGDAIYIVTANGARRVFSAPSIAALAFLPESGDAVFADQKGIVYRLTRDLQFVQIGTVEGVTAIAGASAGRVIAVAGSNIAVLPTDGSPVANVKCSCNATTARPLGHSKFLLTSGDDGPLWLLDASAAELRLAFIPEAVNE
jgi:hypothetical protein